MSRETVFVTLFWAAFGLICYTYVAFPCLIALFARFCRSSRPVVPNDLADHDLPRIAMIVAAHNEEAILAAKLANTWRLDYPGDRFQILIGSDGSSDRTNAILNGCDDPRLVAFAFQDRRGKSPFSTTSFSVPMQSSS